MTTYVARWGNPSKDVVTEIEFDALSLEGARSRATQLALIHQIPERLREVRVKGQTYAETASQRRFTARARAQSNRVPA
jgi:hypothetical protein